MILEIRHVKRCRNRAYGNFHGFRDGHALITVSLEKNKRLSEYMATVLHELLHGYTTIVRRAGFRTTDKKEHRWIEACETAVLQEFTKHFKQRKRKKRGVR